MPSSKAKQDYLDTCDREHAITMKVLRAYPEEKLDLRPHPKSKSARELAWVFVLERGLGTMVWHDHFAKGQAMGEAPKPPEAWSDILAACEKAHADFRALVAGASEADLEQKISFFVAPKTMGQISRWEWIWFLLHDEIHHRGQFSVYLRLAGAKVPSIYGPSADEPWM
ncbi:MAG TPA: DinB family protein [Thermoanaerobaculia bacterium]|nr:DinB family protein [Thermoanaerobaculia bacterium]